jgi:hypothetical protein
LINYKYSFWFLCDIAWDVACNFIRLGGEDEILWRTAGR